MPPPPPPPQTDQVKIRSSTPRVQFNLNLHSAACKMLHSDWLKIRTQAMLTSSSSLNEFFFGGGGRGGGCYLGSNISIVFIHLFFVVVINQFKQGHNSNKLYSSCVGPFPPLINGLNLKNRFLSFFIVFLNKSQIL